MGSLRVKQINGIWISLRMGVGWVPASLRLVTYLRGDDMKERSPLGEG